MSGFLKVLSLMADEIEALRSEGVEQYLILDDVDADLRALASGGTSKLASEALRRKTNEPTGFVRSKLWSAVPAGWFVQAKPGGDWYEVLATRAMHSDLQLVKLRIGNGEVETQRPRGDWVSCRAGSLTNPIGDAVQALGDGVEILEDRP